MTRSRIVIIAELPWLQILRLLALELTFRNRPSRASLPNQPTTHSPLPLLSRLSLLFLCVCATLPHTSSLTILFSIFSHSHSLFISCYVPVGGGHSMQAVSQSVTRKYIYIF